MAVVIIVGDSGDGGRGSGGGVCVPGFGGASW